MLEHLVHVWVDVGANHVALSRFVEAVELGTSENTTQALVVDLAEVVLVDSLSSSSLGVGLHVLSKVSLGRHRHLGQWLLMLLLLMTLLVHLLLLIVVVDLASSLLRVLLPLAILARVSSRCRSRLVLLVDGSMLGMLSLIWLLSLLLPCKLSQQLEEGKQELTLLRAEILTELLQRCHILLDLLSFLVASEL